MLGIFSSRQGEISSEQLTAQALEAIDRGGELNAFIYVDRQTAVKQSREMDRQRRQGRRFGPLVGILVAVKDNIHVAGMPNTAGTRLLKSFVPHEDAPVVARLKAAGAIVLGKTNMHELAFGITSDSATFGAVSNACDPAYIADLNQAVRFPVVLFETGVLLREYVAEYLPGGTLEALAESIASPDVKGIFAGVLNGDMPESAYRQALERERPMLKAAYADYFASHRVEAVVFPTTPLTARPVSEVGETVELNGQQVPTFLTYIRNTDPGSNAGIPGLSIPLAVAAGAMPVGVEIDGPEGSDRRLLAIGAAIEALTQEVGTERAGA